jgi:hypothetical protein
MAHVEATLLIECRTALALSQEKFGDILGRTKRTIQRWEERGTVLMPSEVEALARKIHPIRADLAAQLAAEAGTTLDQLGIPLAVSSSATQTPDPIDRVMDAAASAMGVPREAIRPAVAAAFAKAHEVGLDVPAVIEGLSRPKG